MFGRIPIPDKLLVLMARRLLAEVARSRVRSAYLQALALRTLASCAMRSSNKSQEAIRLRYRPRGLLAPCRPCRAPLPAQASGLRQREMAQLLSNAGSAMTTCRPW